MLLVYLSSLRKRKKNLQKNKKGFTLIELIVVIAILAILMAILIPSIGGIIGNARHQSGVADARSIYIAAQAYATSQTAAGTPVADGTGITIITPAEVESQFSQSDALNQKLTASPATASITSITTSNGAVTSVHITETGVPNDKSGNTTLAYIAYPQGS